MQLPSIPNGQTTNTTNLVVFREQTSISHKHSKSTLLAALRAIAEPPMVGETHSVIAHLTTDTQLVQQRARMVVVREQIAEVRGRSSSIDAEPSQRSALEAVVGFTKQIPRIALSLPNTTPPIKAAMKAPLRQGQAKGSSNRADVDALLGENTTLRRRLDAMIDKAEYLAGLEQEGSQFGQQLEAETALELFEPLRGELTAMLANAEGALDVDDQLREILQRFRNGANTAPAELHENILNLLPPASNEAGVGQLLEPVVVVARRVVALLTAERGRISTLAGGQAQGDQALLPGNVLVRELKERRDNLGVTHVSAAGVLASTDVPSGGDAAPRVSLTKLNVKLAGQPLPRGDQLRNEAVLQLVERALASELPGHVDAAGVLDALCDTSSGELMNPARHALGSPVQRVASAIAVLPCGIEILKRMVLPDAPVPELTTVAENSPARTPHQARLDGLARDEALLVYLRAAKVKVELGENSNPTTAALLVSALEAAQARYANPHAVPLRTAAYSAVRSGLLASGSGSHADFIGGRLEKLRGLWITRAVARADRPFGRVGQGSQTGLASVLNLLPSTGKTPFGKGTLTASARTSTSYGVDPTLTGARMDEHIKGAAAGLRSGFVTLLREPSVDRGKLSDLLVHLAAADVAMEQVRDGQVRPELCTPPDLSAVNARLHALLGDPQASNWQGEPVSELTAAAAQPLKAEHLIQFKQELLRLATGESDRFSTAAFEPAFVLIDKLEKIIDTSPPPVVTNREVLHRCLSILLEQLELRGKVRLQGGGVEGGSSRSVSEAISDLSWGAGIGVTPKLNGEAMRGRTAVFEMSMGSLGFELMIGSERRKSGTGAIGVGAGAGIPLAKVGVAFDMGVNVDDIVLEGVKFTIPRSRTGAYTDEQMRDEGQKLLHALLLQEDSTDIEGLPGSLAAILQACPHVSVVRSDIWSDRSLTQDSAATVSLSSKPKVGDAGQSLGGSGSVTIKNTRLLSRIFQQSDRLGYFRIERRNSAYGGSSSVRFGAGVSATVFQTDDPTRASTSIGASGKSRTMTLDLQGGDVKVRIVSEHGRLQTANTRRDLEFNRVDAILAEVESDRETWLQLGAEERFKDPKFAGMPREEKRRLAGISLDEMQQACRDAEHDEDGTTVLRNVFGLSFKMVDDVASQFNYLLAQEAQVDAEIDKLTQGMAAPTLRALAARVIGRQAPTESPLAKLKQEKILLLAAKDALLLEDSSWKAWRFTSSERTLQKSQKGVDLVVKIVAHDSADGQRPIKSWPV